MLFEEKYILKYGNNHSQYIPLTRPTIFLLQNDSFQ